MQLENIAMPVQYWLYNYGVSGLVAWYGRELGLS